VATPRSRRRHRPEGRGRVSTNADALPVRVGVAFVGTIIVFCLIMGARSLNRRPQH
jgi:D-alanyl-D-alanine carboxypeptidase (penicillin-binding protein 5/6)